MATAAANIAERLAECSEIDVVMIGGQLRGPGFSAVGPLATSAIAALRADVAFLSCD